MTPQMALPDHNVIFDAQEGAAAVLKKGALSLPAAGRYLNAPGGQVVNKHRSWTPGLREANLLIYFVNLADNRGPDRRRPGPHPERISSRYIKALRSSELGSRFGAYSHIHQAIDHLAHIDRALVAA